MINNSKIFTWEETHCKLPKFQLESAHNSQVIGRGNNIQKKMEILVISICVYHIIKNWISA